MAESALDGIFGDLNFNSKEKKKKASKSVDALNVLGLLSSARKTEVYLPVLKISVIMTPFVGAEDLYLQTLKVSGATYHRYIDELLYKHAEFIGVNFESFDDFLKNIPSVDKQVMMAGLLQATFNELPEKLIKCPKCGQVDTYSFKPEHMIHSDSFTKYWDKDIEPSDFRLVNELIPGVKIFYGMPMEQDRLDVLQNVSSSEMRDNLEKHKDVLSLVDFMAIYIKRMEITAADGTVIELNDKKEDILPTIKNMPLDLQVKLIDDPTVDSLTEYNPYYYLKLKCGAPACQHEFKWDDINPENDFFRKALSLYNR